MMPIVDKYSDMGTVVIGKVESGECEKGKYLGDFFSLSPIYFSLSYFKLIFVFKFSRSNFGNLS